MFRFAGRSGNLWLPHHGEIIDLEIGVMVEYHQRARFAWHAENPHPCEVPLGLIGEYYFGQGPPPLSVAPVPALGNNPACQYFSESRFVDNHHEAAMAGAQVTLIAHLPHRHQVFALGPTDEQGATARAFDIGKATSGTPILLDLMPAAGEVAGETRTAFLRW